MNQRVSALTSFHGCRENVGPWEPTRTLSGFFAYCFCCNYNRKKGVSARRSSYCRGPAPKTWELEGRGVLLMEQRS